MTLTSRSKTAYAALAAGLLVVLALTLAGCLQTTGKKTVSADREVPKGLPATKVEAKLVSPPGVPAPVTRREPAHVTVKLETTERVAKVADGAATTIWTFNGSVPGPMIRVRVGDVVDLTLKNDNSSKMPHSIDLHAVTGPGGGARATQLIPGKEATFRFRALNPGIYVYHCATPIIPEHVSRGMYGLIVVEPEKGLPRVDKEFYVMQGDFYLKDDSDAAGVREHDIDKMAAEHPDYVVFNGAVGSLVEEGALKAKVGDKVRIFFGVGGPNVVSSFHVIGEIFDTVYPEGASEPLHDVQTTLVPAGGATIVDFKVEVPGTYLLVDHSLGRLLKGAAGQLVVEGDDNPNVFKPLEGATGSDAGH